MTKIAGPIPPFVDILFEAVCAVEVGFLFQLGGCFAMAIALHEEFDRISLPNEMMFSDDEGHAMVRIGEQFVDWWRARLVSESEGYGPLPVTSFEDLAHTCSGHRLAEYLTLARTVVASAKQLANTPSARKFGAAEWRALLDETYGLVEMGIWDSAIPYGDGDPRVMISEGIGILRTLKNIPGNTLSCSFEPPSIGM